MGNNFPNPNQTVFEEIKETDENGNEFWGARKLSKILDYARFRNFIPVIERAKETCKNSTQSHLHHFVDYHEMVGIGSGAKRQMESVKLSRYACYLIVQNADSGKEIVALEKELATVQNEMKKYLTELGV